MAVQPTAGGQGLKLGVRPKMNGRRSAVKSGLLMRLELAAVVLVQFLIGASAPAIAQPGSWQTKSSGQPAATPQPAQPAASPTAKATSEAMKASPPGLRARPPLAKLPAERAATPGVLVSAAQMTGDKNKTTFNLVLSKGVKAEIVTLANPYRVIIDMPDVVFKLPPGAGREAVGLSIAFRYGLFAEGKARIVIDTDGPVVIDRAEMKPMNDGTGLRLSIDFAPTDAATFGGGTGAARAAAAAALEREQKPTMHEEHAAQPKTRAKPVVMIDPGHGGIDPGAIGGSNLYEKTVVLAVAKQLRAALVASGRYTVVMTRHADVFVSLDQRLKLSRQHAADLFISLHADSIDAKNLTQAIRGASVYTLSERASDSLARLMAEKENASDLIAGLESTEGEGQDQVRSILIDLLKRETANFSADFSRTLVGRLGKSVPISREPLRAAAFKVLKQTGSPSVLVELGYMSNDEDEKLMKSAEWQKQVSISIAQAVEHYFSRRAVGSR